MVEKTSACYLETFLKSGIDTVGKYQFSCLIVRKPSYFPLEFVRLPCRCMQPCM